MHCCESVWCQEAGIHVLEVVGYILVCIVHVSAGGYASAVCIVYTSAGGYDCTSYMYCVCVLEAIYQLYVLCISGGSREGSLGS